jgi:hypothetical protein
MLPKTVFAVYIYRIQSCIRYQHFPDKHDRTIPATSSCRLQGCKLAVTSIAFDIADDCRLAGRAKLLADIAAPMMCRLRASWMIDRGDSIAGMSSSVV